ncbi:IclR family transcriptional regulator [Bacillus sp. ISL-41]|uniref:IclR family transcriptional regulator n=1 Tax=Bacillus sp. ISL-41 TaxID=2819127 RepID=UPI001BE5B516|nr:IclR family transcriptional regulator [Bacillus sp. ISL-41]MBT2644693.1 IclR family transcriptional regulator [Bacillus sp. ISL-41]
MKELSSKINSVEKALSLIEFFDVRNPKMSLQEIAEKTGYSKPTVFRIVCSLEKFGYLKRFNERGEVKFRLGMTFIEKGELVNNQIDLREIAKSEMIRLRSKIGLSVQLAIRDGYEAIYIEQYESLNPIRVFPQVGRRVPLYAAACPRILLAYLPEDELDYILENFTYEAYTKSTITNIEQIKQEIDKIRSKGYSTSKGELYEGTVAIAVPIYSVNNKVIAALSIIGVVNDITNEKQLKEYVNELKKSAASIKQKL